MTMIEATKPASRSSHRIGRSMRTATDAAVSAVWLLIGAIWLIGGIGALMLCGMYDEPAPHSPTLGEWVAGAVFCFCIFVLPGLVTCAFSVRALIRAFGEIPEEKWHRAKRAVLSSVASIADRLSRFFAAPATKAGAPSISPTSRAGEEKHP